jgi:hypothetical protein
MCFKISPEIQERFDAYKTLVDDMCDKMINERSVIKVMQLCMNDMFIAIDKEFLKENVLLKGVDS